METDTIANKDYNKSENNKAHTTNFAATTDMRIFVVILMGDYVCFRTQHIFVTG